MKLNKWKRRACLGLYVAGLIIFLELSSALVLNNLISPERMGRFNTIFLTEPTEYHELPHPYLGWVTDSYLEEQEHYLSYLGENRTNRIYVVALGGSTTATGYPDHTESYLNRQFESANSPLRADVFNFGGSRWTSFTSLQNYVYLVRYLHPDIVIIHHNINDVARINDLEIFNQLVICYPQINAYEREPLRYSRFYRLLKFAYLLSYNQIRYGTGTIYSYEPDLPMQARISSYLNEAEQLVGVGKLFRMRFGQEVAWESGLTIEESIEFLQTENYESLIKYTKADNSALIMTTQYINHSKDKSKPVSWERYSRDINKIIRNVSRRHDVTLVDLDSEMEQYDYLLKEDGVHFTEEGIRLKGELIGEAIFGILKEQYNLSG